MKKYMILPSEYDLNRGDQALVWTTRDIAADAGLVGDYYMLVDNPSLAQQSIDEGFKVLEPVLKHPSRKFKDSENVTYGMSLIMKWGSVALLDLLKSGLFLNKLTRKLGYGFLSNNAKQTINQMKEMDAFFVKGGGFIHSSGKITDWYTIYYSLFHVALAQSLGKPVYVMPNSFGPFKAKGVEGLVKKILGKCELVTVRESISKKQMDQIGVDTMLTPDLGFYLNKNEESVKVLDKIRVKHPDKKLVAITARPYRFPNSENPKERYSEYISSLVEFSNWLYSNDYLPVFIDHTLAIKEHENDSSAIKEIIEQLDRNHYAYIANRDYNCRDLKGIYSGMDFVVGTRFHSVIFSLSETIPSIALTYGGNKGQGIMKDLNLSEYALSMSDTNIDDLKNMFTSLAENEIEVKKKLQDNKVHFNQTYQELVNEISRRHFSN